MKGTEKQVKWAEAIKNKFAKAVRKSYATDEHNTKVVEAALEVIFEKYTDAKFWIEDVENREYDYAKYEEAFADMSKDQDTLQKVMDRISA